MANSVQALYLLRWTFAIGLMLCLAFTQVHCQSNGPATSQDTAEEDTTTSLENSMEDIGPSSDSADDLNEPGDSDGAIQVTWSAALFFIGAIVPMLF
eukprot:g194.t1